MTFTEMLRYLISPIHTSNNEFHYADADVDDDDDDHGNKLRIFAIGNYSIWQNDANTIAKFNRWYEGLFLVL